MRADNVLFVHVKDTRVVNSCVESSGAAEESSDAWRDHVVFVNAVVRDFKSDLKQIHIQTHNHPQPRFHKYRWKAMNNNMFWFSRKQIILIC